MADETTSSSAEQSFDLLLDVPLKVSVELGGTKLRIQELLDLGQGSILELDRMAGEPVDILVNGRAIALGEVVVVNERYAVRVVSVHSAAERVESLG
ncbi:MAG: flagellar motor switch protein FliN [Deltaproteobacteria bacterium]|nr:flagellar motor switch protein FliN [Myxococcales bacterium]MCZ6569001.1 flagellar motor switch protein FliN [Deltaproteobacteria bacterium]TDJ02680.1 MAG: flagellar motor switch protein FliN [Deltaproteobacteria bacterium]